jgi:hypothetical protein
MAKLTGTEPYQVPTNADLGDLAYQNTSGAQIQNIKYGSLQRVLNKKTGATGTVEHSFFEGTLWYHSTVAANFTCNVTNVPTTFDNYLEVRLIISQGATGYYANVLQVNGSAVTVNYDVTPTPSINQFEIQTFKIFNIAGTFFAVGDYAKY